MDEDTILLLLFFGFLLNIALFLAVILKYRHHTLALGAWTVWMAIMAMAVIVRYSGYLSEYFALIDYVTMPLLYVNAFLAAWVLLHNKPKH